MRKTFAYHKPSPAGLNLIAKIRQAFSELADRIDRDAPTSREKSIAMTELETAAMWAIKAVVYNDPSSEVDE